MNAFSQNLFNLLLNSVFSFWAGLFLVLLCLGIFRVENSRWKLFLLSLPFLKILWDLIKRVPSTSILYSGMDPWDFPPKHQTLYIGAGFSQWGPIFDVEFAANGANGKSYSSSIPDYLFFWLKKHVAPSAPDGILLFLLLVSAFFLMRRLLVTANFERVRRKRRGSDTSLEIIPLFWRRIDVYASTKYEGTPFTGGILHPYICFPAASLGKLDESEKRAVLAHERAHIAHWDLIFTLFIKSLGDVLWFVPGYRALCQKIDRLRELLADEAALRHGASAVPLASALVKLKEVPVGTHNAVLYSAFFRERKLLAVRVETLLAEGAVPVRSRFGWRNLWIRSLVTFWTASAVIVATLGGNHEIVEHTIPPWAEKLFHALGLM